MTHRGGVTCVENRTFSLGKICQNFLGLVPVVVFRSHAQTASTLTAGEERVRGEVDEDARKDAPLEGLVIIVFA
jgi:hypothetical protein